MHGHGHNIPCKLLHSLLLRFRELFVQHFTRSLCKACSDCLSLKMSAPPSKLPRHVSLERKLLLRDDKTSQQLPCGAVAGQISGTTQQHSTTTQLPAVPLPWECPDPCQTAAKRAARLYDTQKTKQTNKNATVKKRFAVNPLPPAGHKSHRTW